MLLNYSSTLLYVINRRGPMALERNKDLIDEEPCPRTTIKHPKELLGLVIGKSESLKKQYSRLIQYIGLIIQAQC